MNDDVATVNAERRELQRRVFSAASSPADARVAARQLELLESRHQREASERGRQAAASPEPPSPPAAAHLEQHPAPSFPIPEAVLLASGADPGRSPLSVVVLVAAALFALCLGLAIGVSTTTRAVVVPQSAPARAVVDTTGALALFDRPQVGSDLPAQKLPGTVIAESIRAIGDPFFELYVGRNAANMVCLFAVQPADSFAMSCVTIDEFPSTGVRLEWSGEMASISADGSTGVVPSTMRAIWRPDGSLDLGGGPR